MEVIDWSIWATGITTWTVIIIFAIAWLLEVLNNMWGKWKKKRHWLWHIEDTIKFPYTILRLRLLKAPNPEGLDVIKKWTLNPKSHWFTRIKNPVNKLMYRYVEFRIRRQERSLPYHLKGSK